MSTETRHAADIYEQVKTLRFQLEQLAGEGRLVMSTDDLNQVKYSMQATASALAGLDAAIDATCRMETLSTVGGEYPVSRN